MYRGGEAGPVGGSQYRGDTRRGCGDAFSASTGEWRFDTVGSAVDTDVYLRSVSRCRV